MLSRLFLPVRQMGRRIYPRSQFFNPNTRIDGFTERWCNETAALLRWCNMEHGFHRRSISYSSTSESESVPITSEPGQTAFRGYPLLNLFLNRQETDGGLFTVPTSLTNNVKPYQDTFDMAEYAKERKREALVHLTGNTEYRSFTKSIPVALAFGLSKGPENGAVVLEHWAREGTALIASVYGPASELDYDQVNGLLYQQEIAGPMLPFARQKCTTMFYKKDGCLNPEAGFNIMSPFNLDINQFLLANGDPNAVRVIHKYDRKALQASIEFSECYRELLEGQMNNVGKHELRVLHERAHDAFQKMLKVEEQFRKYIASSIKMQQEQGNLLMAQVVPPSDICLNTALRWYMSAICYSKGKFLTHTDNECTLNVKQGDFILELPQQSGARVTKTFSKEEALGILPHVMLPTFDLISPDGHFDISERLPDPIEQLLVTSFITQLMHKKDPHVGNLRFQTPDASEIRSLCENEINNVQLISQGYCLYE
ncbi:hypothetical protein LEAN103870_04180 [Legionella anisa]|uniref:Uncharacterized protein n=1 Tax=Legionella anisa TaxID=28082 RepID=A0AAX0WSF1_9GAMM|nr:hypothetical protein [Legionella anisa]AWN72940.1 hypothetical protein DLD14_03285 [Legionella anisa]KTC70604.1 hypothetical protein Lani_2151 [Legionella anisa]MBN5935115.1 hypothetical protein [Legionella anisa]MCW8423753.1 hypothetical protein [Legionella anisa]MCW8447273.1 hypothetical protein [Legionella anisa]